MLSNTDFQKQPQNHPKPPQSQGFTSHYALKHDIRHAGQMLDKMDIKQPRSGQNFHTNNWARLTFLIILSESLIDF